jgi:hypothetical protein
VAGGAHRTPSSFSLSHHPVGSRLSSHLGAGPRDQLALLLPGGGPGHWGRGVGTRGTAAWPAPGVPHFPVTANRRKVPLGGKRSRTLLNALPPPPPPFSRGPACGPAAPPAWRTSAPCEGPRHLQVPQLRHPTHVAAGGMGLPAAQRSTTEVSPPVCCWF